MFDVREHTVWIEKYRPTNLETYIGNERMKEKFAGYLEEQDVPHLLLTGPAGTGKTTAAKILINSIDCDSMIINASDDNNIETVRSKIRGFAATRGFRPLKVILLDEFDGFSRAGQAALRNLMEQFIRTTRFILTANYLEQIIEPIISRTQHHTVVPPSKKEVAIHLSSILKNEEIEFTIQDIKYIIDAYFPDIRKIIGESQSLTKNGKLSVDVQQIVENDFKLKVIELISGSGPKKDKLNSIRKLLADVGVRDFSDLYRLLYDKVTIYAPNNISAAILAIADGQYKDALVVDKEINAMATLVNLLEVV